MARKQKDDNKGFIVLLLGGALLLFGRKSGSGESGSSSSGYSSSHSDRPVTSEMLRNAFQMAKAAFGSTIAGQSEQLYRKETRHFDSGQFRKTYSPGMEQAPDQNEFPYGWGSLNTFLSEYPKYKGNFFLVAMTENNTGKTKKYIGFPTLEGAVMFLAWTIKKRGNPGYWRSWDEQVAANYAESLKAYNIEFT